MKTLLQSFIVAYILTGAFAMSAAQNEIILFDFKNPDYLKPWQIINDTVMGGISESSLRSSGSGTALFTGAVSLKNFGGFCSASSRENKNYDLSTSQGIAARIRGDGKAYKLTLKTDTSFNGYAYQLSFTTKKDQWLTVQAPFKDFIARFRGTTQPDAPPVKKAEIKSFGFLIGDKQEGPFSLEVEWIKAY
ncbi:MAG: CIA30 family protein [Pseudomonadota bacterium]